MDDVAYRINTSLPVKTKGTIMINDTGNSKIYSEDNTHTKTVTNESVSGTGLVNRFDDVTYYG